MWAFMFQVLCRVCEKPEYIRIYTMDSYFNTTVALQSGGFRICMVQSLCIGMWAYIFQVILAEFRIKPGCSMRMQAFRSMFLRHWGTTKRWIMVCYGPIYEQSCDCHISYFKHSLWKNKWMYEDPCHGPMFLHYGDDGSGFVMMQSVHMDASSHIPSLWKNRMTYVDPCHGSLFLSLWCHKVVDQASGIFMVQSVPMDVSQLSYSRWFKQILFLKTWRIFENPWFWFMFLH